MYKGNPSAFLALIVQGMLIDSEYSILIETLVRKFRIKSLPVCAFGPSQFSREGYRWISGKSAQWEMEKLLEELFVQDRWIHPWETLVVTDSTVIATEALGLQVEGILFLGETNLTTGGRIFCPDDVETILVDIPAPVVV